VIIFSKKKKSVLFDGKKNQKRWVVRILQSKIANPYGISKLLCNFETRFAPDP
jgi:hypothetical protein